MKKLLFILSTLLSLSAFSQVKVDVGGDIAPIGNYPAVKVANVKGSTRTVYDTFARNAILANFRDTGMIVTTTKDGYSWKLIGGLTNPYWVNLSYDIKAINSLNVGTTYGLIGDTTKVEGGGYDPILTTTANTGGLTNMAAISMAHRSRIRQSGSITKIQMYFASKPAQLTAFYYTIWRKNTAGTFDKVGEENILSKITGGALNTITLTTPIPVLESDYQGWNFTGSGTVPAFMTGMTISSGQYYTQAAPTSTGYNWIGQTLNGGYVPIKAFMAAPILASISNSIMAGYPTHYPYINTTVANDLENSPPYLIGQTLGISVQNLGIPGEQTYSLVNRFSTDVLAIKPRAVVIEAGVNDVGGYDVHGAGVNGANLVSSQTIVANFLKMTDSAVAHNITPMPLLILPWTNGSNTFNTTIDSINAALLILVPLHGGIPIDARSAVGKFRAGGATGNLWDIQTAYNLDGVHFSAAGKAALATLVATVISTNIAAINGAVPGQKPYPFITDAFGNVANKSITSSSLIGTGFTFPKVDANGKFSRDNSVIVGGNNLMALSGTNSRNIFQVSGNNSGYAAINDAGVSAGLEIQATSQIVASLQNTATMGGWKGVSIISNSNNNISLGINPVDIRTGGIGDVDIRATFTGHGNTVIQNGGLPVEDTTVLFQVNSTTQGVLLPRMTAVQKNAITKTPIGLIIYQNDSTEGFYIRKSTGWRKLVEERVATPTVALGANITGSVSVSGTDAKGTITVTVTGVSSLTTLNELFTLTFSSSFINAPIVVYSCSSVQASTINRTAGTYLKNKSTTSFQIATEASYTTGASDVYKFDYQIQ